MLALSPDRIRSGLVARHQRTARPVRDADGSVSRHGFARRAVIPGLSGKCAHGRSRNAGAPVNITSDGRGIRIGLLCDVPRGYATLPSHGGSCDHGCGDQRSRQNLSHSISPLDMKANGVGSSWKWRSDRPIKVTFPHVVSTRREVGASPGPKSSATVLRTRARQDAANECCMLKTNSES
jgi:hypothetical protein